VKTETLNVTGMTCGGCVASVKRALGALTGVSTVAVSLADGRVDVGFDENLVGREAMRDALRHAGYGVATQSVRTKPRGSCCS